PSSALTWPLSISFRMRRRSSGMDILPSTVMTDGRRPTTGANADCGQWSAVSGRSAAQQLHRVLNRDLLGGQAIHHGAAVGATVRLGRCGIAQRLDNIVQPAARGVVGDLQLAG